MIIRKFISPILSAVLFSSSIAAFALQTIEPVEGENTFVKVSQKELTRIAIDGGKIRSLIGSEGELSVEKDKDLGQIFVRPLVSQKPINVRIQSSSGHTYGLVLTAVDIPQEDIVIREIGVAAEPSAKADRATGNIEKTVKAMVVGMAADEAPRGMEFHASNDEVALWEGTRFILTGTYTDRNLVGQKYKLYNVGADRIRIAEQELFRKGVVAIAIENLALDPGQVTNVYVIRSN